MSSISSVTPSYLNKFLT